MTDTPMVIGHLEIIAASVVCADPPEIDNHLSSFARVEGPIGSFAPRDFMTWLLFSLPESWVSRVMS